MKTVIFCVFKVGVGKKGEARMKFFFVFKPRKWILCQKIMTARAVCFSVRPQILAILAILAFLAILAISTSF